MGKLLSAEEPAEECIGPSHRCLHDAGWNAEDLGEPGQAIVGVQANARQRFDATLVRVDVRTIAEHEDFEARNSH